MSKLPSSPRTSIRRDVPADNRRKFGFVSRAGWTALKVAVRVTSMPPVSRSVVSTKYENDGWFALICGAPNNCPRKFRSSRKIGAV
jgi:hypothetical protein